MKIEGVKKIYWKVFILQVLGWLVAILLGRNIRPFFLVSILLWVMALIPLFKDFPPYQKKDPIRISLIMMLSTTILFFLGGITGQTVLIITLGGIWEVTGIIGFIACMNELSRKSELPSIKKLLWKKWPSKKKTSKPAQTPKKTTVDQKRRCQACGAELKNTENGYCKKCKEEHEHAKCSECGSEFLINDMHVVEESFYCQSCFEKKFANFSEYGEPDDTEEEIAEEIANETAEEPIPCFSTMQAMFDHDPERQPTEGERKRLCKEKLFIIYTIATMQPMCYMDRLCAYDSYELAVKALEEKIPNATFREYFYPMEIRPEELADEIKKCLCSGFGSVVVNNEYAVNLSELPVYEKTADYGTICPMACNYMISYKERILAFECDEAAEDRGRTQEDRGKQNALFAGVVHALEKSVLLIPDEEKRKLILGNQQLLIVFTDRYALKAYDPTSSIEVEKITFEELQKVAEGNVSVSGIVVNPGREDFKMRKS